MSNTTKTRLELLVDLGGIGESREIYSLPPKSSDTAILAKRKKVAKAHGVKLSKVEVLDCTQERLYFNY